MVQLCPEVMPQDLNMDGVNVFAYPGSCMSAALAYL